MKVLFINSVCDYGSTGKIVRGISDELKERGNQVLICYGREPVSKGEDTFYFGSKFNTMIHGVMTRLFGRHGLHSNGPTRKLISKIREFAPDVVHLNNLHGYYLNVPMLFDFLNESKINVVWTLHDCWSISGSGAHFDFYGCNEWNEGCVICNDTKAYPRSYLFKRQRRNFKWKREVFTQLPAQNMKIITPSDWLKDLVESSFLKKYEIKRIYNGIDTNIFKPKSDKIKTDTVTILGVANVWDERKGLYKFIELSERLSEKYSIILIGLDEKQIEMVPNRIKTLKRTNDIHELADYYSNADIYINLSVEETMGMTTIEAIACGTPVIVLDATAVPEIVTKDVGVVVDCNDFNALIEAIEKFSFENYNRDMLVRYAEKFTTQEMVKQYSDIINKSFEIYNK